MDEIELRKFETDMKLEKETNNLAIIKASMAKSNLMTQNMLSILDTFDQRLRKLEDTITPVYHETGNLQRRQENIDRTIYTLDHVISFYHIAKEVDYTIREGPSNGLQNYLECMDKLKVAIKYFTENNAGSPEYSAVSHLFEVGRESIECEFRTLLTRHSKPVPPLITLELINPDDDVLPDQHVTPSSVEHLPQRVIDDLLSISRWLKENQASPQTDFVTVYATTRSHNLIKSLQSLRDHQKKASLGGKNSPMLPSKMRGGKDTPTRRATAKRGTSHVKKTSNLIKSSMNSLDPTSLKRTPSFNVDAKEDGTEYVEISFYLLSISGLLKLIQSEAVLMNQIIEAKDSQRCFDMLIQSALEMVVNEGEQINAIAKKAVTRNDYSGLVTVFPVIRQLESVKAGFDLVLEGCQAPTRAKLSTLKSSLDSTGAKGLESFIESIRTDPDKQSNMPKDGTVHELTSNVMIFLEQLLDYTVTAGTMLIIQDMQSLSPQQREQKCRLKLADYLIKVLSALGLNLNIKSETYSDVTLRSIFMLNNYNYILKSMRRSTLVSLVACSNPAIEQDYSDKILGFKKQYSTSFSKLLNFTTDSLKHLQPAELVKLRDKDRQVLKDKFTGFNRELEEIGRIQKTYAIPDMELREKLIQDNKDFVVPHYREFFEKYSPVNFTKNPEKYIKYTTDDVQKALDRFFDSAA